MYVCDIRRDIFAAHWRLTILSFEIRQISMESCSVELPQILGEGPSPSAEEYPGHDVTSEFGTVYASLRYYRFRQTCMRRHT